jgi:heme exporter protein C
MSMMIYMVMAIAGGIGLVWRIKLAEVIAASSAPIGASFTFLALLTGALWGKPMWGAWWVWDARLTSELILLFLYLGVIALHSAIEDKRIAARATAVLALVGVVNIPIIHYSVEWWNTLHQGATITKFDAPSIHISMLIPLLLMAVAFKLYYALTVLMRARCEVLERERNSSWVQALVKSHLKSES